MFDIMFQSPVMRHSRSGRSEELLVSPRTYLILPASAIPIPRSSVFPVTTTEIISEEVKQLMMELDNGRNDHIGDERTDQQIIMQEIGATERYNI
jgi:hypothetical protein